MRTRGIQKSEERHLLARGLGTAIPRLVELGHFTLAARHAGAARREGRADDESCPGGAAAEASDSSAQAPGPDRTTRVATCRRARRRAPRADAGDRPSPDRDGATDTRAWRDRSHRQATSVVELQQTRASRHQQADRQLDWRHVARPGPARASVSSRSQIAGDRRPRRERNERRRQRQPDVAAAATAARNPRACAASRASPERDRPPLRPRW